MMQALISMLLIFSMERPVFLRERANKSYTIGPYFSSRNLVDLPFQLVQPFIFGVIVYFGMGLE